MRVMQSEENIRKYGDTQGPMITEHQFLALNLQDKLRLMSDDARYIKFCEVLTEEERQQMLQMMTDSQVGEINSKLHMEEQARH